jgi:hypothetical protein
MKIRTVVAVCVMTAWRIAGAQESVERFERNLQQIQRDTQARVDRDFPPDQRALIDYGGYLTFDYLSFDDAAHDNHGLRRYELVAFGRVNLDGAHEFYARGRSDYFDYNPGDGFNGQGDHLEGRFEEAWYRFDLRRYEAAYEGRQIQGDVAVKAGRQFVAWGNGLTLDQYVDGGFAELSGGPFVADLLACVTVRETIDFDTSRPHFFDDTHRGFFGVRLGAAVGTHRPYAYFLLQRDYNRDEPTDAHVIPTRYDYQSYYAGVGSNGAIGDHLSYGGELTFEGGHDLSNSYNTATLNPVSQQTDRIEAYAGDFKLEYLPNDVNQSRLGIEAVIASGDTDRVYTTSTFGGNRPGTVDHAFNSLGVLYTGVAFNPQVSNLIMLRLGASTFPVPFGPTRRLQVGTDLFFYGKTRRNGPIEEPTNNSRFLGIEPDAFMNWQIVDDVTLAVRYGIFIPGDAIPSGDQKHLRQFLYAGLTYAF